MSSTALLERLRRSLALRLSVLFAALFALGFTAIFSLLYVLLGRQLEARDFEALRLRLQQYADIYEANGLRGMRQRIAEDSEAPHVRSLFVRLVGPRGDLVWGKVPPDWIEKDAREVKIPDGWGGWNVRRVYPVRVPRDQQRDIAVVSTVLPDGLLLQVGRSTDSRAALLVPLRATFAWVGGAVVLVGSFTGYIMARRATRPLQNVVETARRIISTGALDARVPPTGRDDEVGELVHHFNTVLDKNAALLKSMREALDNVAHDLKTPLTSLRGTAELALTQLDQLPGAGRDALADCVERADDVLRLLKALMEISEAEAGMLRLNRSETDLGLLANAAADLYSEMADAKNIRLQVEASEAPINGDPIRLRQAIANLIDNAIKYTPDGGRVEVKSVQRDGSAVLTVRDTGPGVPAAEQPRIWERLYRGDQSRSQSGLGLGLSLVRAIVEAHGGSTTVQNSAEGGAVFEMRLPLAGTRAVPALPLEVV
jgi:signal transduction histidine kinase